MVWDRPGVSPGEGVGVWACVGVCVGGFRAGLVLSVTKDGFTVGDGVGGSGVADEVEVAVGKPLLTTMEGVEGPGHSGIGADPKRSSTHTFTTSLQTPE